MYGKLLIKAQLKVLTGMHIGTSNAFSAIGAVDSPVITDMRTKRPILPGSSLKGKMRTLLARSLANDIENLPEANKDDITIRRLFGSSEDPIIRGRLQFADAFVSNADEFKASGLTEIKFENTITRDRAEAKPRQIERVISGVKFGVNIVYDLTNTDELEEDFMNIAKAMRLLQLDYLGGHGTRGSGRVSFEDIELIAVEAELDSSKLDKLRTILKEVESYELLSI